MKNAPHERTWYLAGTFEVDLPITIAHNQPYPYSNFDDEYSSQSESSGDECPDVPPEDRVDEKTGEPLKAKYGVSGWRESEWMKCQPPLVKYFKPCALSDMSSNFMITKDVCCTPTGKSPIAQKIYDQLPGMLNVLGPHAAGQTVDRVIGNGSDRFEVVVAERHGKQHGAENFFPCDFQILIGVGEQGRLNKEAFAFGRFTAAHEGGAFIDPGLDVIHNAFTLLRRD